MTAVGELIGDLVRIVGSQPGWIGVALALSLAGLLVRLYLSRKRLSFKEEFNSKIGIVPFAHEHGGKPQDSELAVFNHVSVVLIKIRNSGRVGIDAADWLERLSFAVTGRYIVDFRVSGPKPSDLFKKGPEQNYVDTLDVNWEVRPREGDAVMLRPALREGLPGTLGARPGTELSAEEKDQRRRLILPAIELKPGHSFNLVVCLRSDDINGRHPAPVASVRDYEFTGELDGGKVVDLNRPRRRPSATRVLAALVAVLSVLLVVAIVVRPAGPAYCGAGDLRVVGSSAFAPTSATIEDGYRADCGEATFSSAMAGSLEGVRELRQASAEDRSRLVAFSDGGAVGDTGSLQRRPIAVVIYALVANRSAGVQNLTPEQVKAINSGEVRNWAQLGGADLPIRVVGRGPDSGSRQAFEKYVLAGPEAPVSSNSCATVDRPAAGPVIRCERQTTSEVLDQVDRLPGAFGYADASPVARYGNVDRLRIAGLEPTSEYLQRGYGFWTIEYAYTDGIAPGGGLLDRYLGYLSSDAAARRLREAAYIPCVRSDRSLESLCQENR